MGREYLSINDYVRDLDKCKAYELLYKKLEEKKAALANYEALYPAEPKLTNNAMGAILGYIISCIVGSYIVRAITLNNDTLQLTNLQHILVTIAVILGTYYVGIRSCMQFVAEHRIKQRRKTNAINRERFMVPLENDIAKLQEKLKEAEAKLMDDAANEEMVIPQEYWLRASELEELFYFKNAFTLEQGLELLNKQEA